MKISDINIKNIKSFVEGNVNYFKDVLFGSPDFILEQIEYRLIICSEDCLVEDKCKYCGCPPKQKVWVSLSCNEGERFPNLMKEEEWEEYKKQNNIKITL